MAVRPHPTKGSGWWRIIIYQGKDQKQLVYPFQGTKAQALSYEADLRGISPTATADQKLLDILGQFLDWYFLHRSARTATDAEASLPRIIQRIGNKHISLLRQHDYDLYKHARSEDGVTRKTVNIELGYLRAMLVYARDELHLEPGDLPKMYTKKQTRPPDVIPLTPDEIARLLHELHGDKKTIAMLYAWCGLRRNEALHLKTKNIDLQTGLIYVTGKGDKPRIVPIVGHDLHDRLAHAMKHYPKINRGKQVDTLDKIRDKKADEYLFICARTGKPYLDIKNGLKQAAVRAKINKPVANHLLRHSGATGAIQAGVDIRTLQQLLGHSDIRMTERYTHMAADMMHQAGDKLAALHNRAGIKARDIRDTENQKNNKVIQIDRNHKS